jgi:hypothetical protein
MATTTKSLSPKDKTAMAPTPHVPLSKVARHVQAKVWQTITRRLGENYLHKK